MFSPVTPTSIRLLASGIIAGLCRKVGEMWTQPSNQEIVMHSMASGGTSIKATQVPVLV
jgi:hypothetical protein